MVNKFLMALTVGLAMPISAVTLEECPTEPAVEVCDNGLDDDGDTFIDCRDYDCAAEAHCEGSLDTCQDAGDNDGDGFIDCQDFDCKQNCDTAELCGSTEATVEACTDGADNDQDGFTDCDDYDCNRNVCDAVRELCE